MFGGKASQAVCSRSPEYPTNAELFRGLLANLLSSDSWEWAHFEASDRLHWLEIADDGDALLVNVSFPFANTYEEVLRESDVVPPATWQLTTYRRYRWWAAGYIEYRVPRLETEQVITFIEIVFQRLFLVASYVPINGWLAR